MWIEPSAVDAAGENRQPCHVDFSASAEDRLSRLEQQQTVSITTS